MAAKTAKVNEPSRRFSSETKEAVLLYDSSTLDILVRDLARIVPATESNPVEKFYRNGTTNSQFRTL